MAAAIIAVMLSFAANSLITRHLVLGYRISPFPLTVIRFLSGLIALRIVTAALPKSFHKDRATRRDILGAFFLGSYAFDISYGYVFISAAAGTFVFYSMVVLSMSTYSVLFEKEKLNFRLLAGQTLGIIGVFLITFSGIGAISPLGVALMSITGISWGMYSAFGKRATSYFSYTYNTFLILGLISVALVVGTIPFAGFEPWLSIQLPDLSLALYMGMISTAIVYVLWNKILTRLRVSQGGLVQLLVPVLTSILGILLLSESITVTFLVGAAMILVGIYANTLGRNNQKKISH